VTAQLTLDEQRAFTVVKSTNDKLVIDGLVLDRIFDTGKIGDC
jgi:hypothetical protein